MMPQSQPIGPNFGDIYSWIAQQASAQNPQSQGDIYKPVIQQYGRWNQDASMGPNALNELLSSWASGLNTWRRGQGMLPQPPTPNVYDEAYSARIPSMWNMGASRQMPSFGLGGFDMPSFMPRSPMNPQTRQTFQGFQNPATAQAQQSFATPMPPASQAMQQAVAPQRTAQPSAPVTALGNYGARAYMGSGMSPGVNASLPQMAVQALSRLTNNPISRGPGFSMYSGGGYGR